MMIEFILPGTALLALVHLLAGRLDIPRLLPRPAWLSFAGGVATAYIFVHILPIFSRFIVDAATAHDRWRDGEWIFVAALAGTVAFYGVEKLVRGDVAGNAARNKDEPHPRLSFWLHISAFGIYNALIGYLSTDHTFSGRIDAAVYYIALALHFVIVDRDLRTRHGQLYDNAGQWIMAGSVIAGTAAGLAALLPAPVAIAAFAFLAGGMILNVFKEEIPGEQRGRVLPFAFGAGLFGVLFLVT